MPLSRIENEIPGAYQLDALLRGKPLQRAWHRARLDLVASLLPPARDTLSLDLAAGAGIVTWRFRESPVVSVDMRVDACQAIRDHTYLLSRPLSLITRSAPTGLQKRLIDYAASRAAIDLHEKHGFVPYND